MLPDEVFKRRPRHNNTPASTLLIIVNFIVLSLGMTLFVTKDHIQWFFWVILGVLAVYNFFTIRRNLEDFSKIVIISYVASIVVMAVLFFLLKGQA
jgi:nicotinamide riboside transporter PnuC